MDAVSLSRSAASVDAARAHNALRRQAAYTALCLLVGLAALVAMGSGSGLRPLAVTIFVLGGCAILTRPIIGIYLIVFFGLLGDANIAWWYPFTKNLSSPESVLYVHDAVVLNPLELYLVLTFVAWGLHVFGGRSMPLRRAALWWPLTIFTAFVAASLVHGLVTGGNSVVALWEIRPLVLPWAVYVLTSALFTQRRHYGRLLWVIVAALSLEALHTAYVISVLSGAAAERAQGLGYLEHSASLHFNTLFVLLVSAWLYRGSSRPKRQLLPVLAVVVLLAYLPAERRSAIVALIAAALLLSVILYRERRGTFWLVVPAVVIVGIGYVGAFWNSSGAMAFPAQAVKSVVAPEQLGAADASSNFYRQVETYNVVATIRSSPLVGLGLGHEFHQVLPLPYIPFVWAQYLPHNSILWIWISTGVGGFVAMLYLLALSVRNGVASAMRLRGDDAALVTTAALYVVMYVVYAYVDIAWDTQSMLYLGVALALIDNLERLPSRATAQPDPASDVRTVASRPAPVVAGA